MEPEEIENNLIRKSFPSGIWSKGTNLTYQDKQNWKNGLTRYYIISRN